MSLELFAVGEYKGVTILVKRGNCLKEFPYYFTEEFAKPFICKFSIYSDLPVNLSLESGLAGKIMQLSENNLPAKIAERGTKRPKPGEIVFVPQNLTHWESLIFVVLPELENPNEDDRIELIEYMKNGFDIAEQNEYDALVVPGFPIVFSMFPLDTAASMQLEALEMFLENRSTTYLKIISLCIESDEELQSFLRVGQERFQKFSTWLFLKSAS